MKLKVYALNEADNDIAKGYRLKQIAGIKKQIENDITRAGYKISTNGDLTLNILPAQGYLVNVTLELHDDNAEVDIFDIKTTGCIHNKDLGADDSSVNNDELPNALEKLGNTIVEYLMPLTPEKLKEQYLTEAPGGNIFSKAFSKIKNNIKDMANASKEGSGMSLKDKAAIYKANKADRKEKEAALTTLASEFTQSLNTALKNIATKDCSAIAQFGVNDNKITVQITSPYLFSLVWTTVSNNIVIPSAIVSPFGSYKISSDNASKDLSKLVDIALEKIKKALNINFSELPEPEKETEKETDKAEDEEEKTNQSQEKESETDQEPQEKSQGQNVENDPYLAKLKNELSDFKDILFRESFKYLNEDTNINYDLYDQALETADHNEIKAIIKLLLYREAQIKEDQLTPGLMRGLIESVIDLYKSVSPQVNLSIRTFLTYYKNKNKMPPDWFFDVVNHLDSSALRKIINKYDAQSADKILDGSLNVLYFDPFWEASTNSAELRRLFNSVYSGRLTQDNLKNELKLETELRTKNEHSELKDILEDDFSDTWDEDNWLDLKKAILFRNNGKFRNISQLQDAIDAIGYSYSSNKEKKVDQTRETPANLSDRLARLQPTDPQYVNNVKNIAQQVLNQRNMRIDGNAANQLVDFLRTVLGQN